MNLSKSMITKLVLIGIAATSCGQINVQVKKDAKNSTLQSSSNSAAESKGGKFSLANPEDFLKAVDGLRTVAADILIKQLATQDYVGKFRGGVRKYQSFLIEKSQKQVSLSDSFYDDASKECRDSGLSLNIDRDNEVLGMLLQTAILAKIGEMNVGKLNAGLTKELQSLTQFITMELGVDIKGTSSFEKDGDYDVTKGAVTIQLKPISGESIDDATKLADEKSVLTLNFERRLGTDSIGTFHAELGLTSVDAANAVAKFDISRSKESDHYRHLATVTMGLKDQTPAYSRQIIVSDIPGEKMQFNFTDILNAGKTSESSHKTVIDVEKGTQCKVKGSDSDDSRTDGKGDDTPTNNGGSSNGGTTGGKPNTTQTPTQTPVQVPIKK